MKKVKEVETMQEVDVKCKSSGCHVDRLNIRFPNEDLNKLVDKLNEVIEKYGN